MLWALFRHERGPNLDDKLSNVAKSGVHSLLLKDITDFDWDEVCIHLPQNENTYQVDWTVREWSIKFSKAGCVLDKYGKRIDQDKFFMISRNVLDLKTNPEDMFRLGSFCYDKNTPLQLVDAGNIAIFLNRTHALDTVTTQEFEKIRQKLRRAINSGVRQLALKDLTNFAWDKVTISIPQGATKDEWSISFQTLGLWSSKFFRNVGLGIANLQPALDLSIKYQYCYSKDKVLQLHGNTILLDLDGELCSKRHACFNR